jgi:hypothetical protein
MTPTVPQQEPTDLLPRPKMADVEMGDAAPVAKSSKTTEAGEKRPRFEIKKVSFCLSTTSAARLTCRSGTR